MREKTEAVASALNDGLGEPELGMSMFANKEDYYKAMVKELLNRNATLAVNCVKLNDAWNDMKKERDHFRESLERITLAEPIGEVAYRIAREALNA